ncbi:hypothetical protein [Erysipelothrix rhusiopathiae]|uniref:hypothetical protein n=1 Tax=Erysipelothrix rhusiopathiae TaxID=1648 RepID=UPI002B24567B|nr:hypothetical protein [Erysipelothrix rhusiopathiae]WRB92941.1 hypothetical protein LL063_08250 [Erysipelothrix rhusiopathiae]
MLSSKQLERLKLEHVESLDEALDCLRRDIKPKVSAQKYAKVVASVATHYAEVYEEQPEILESDNAPISDEPIEPVVVPTEPVVAPTVGFSTQFFATLLTGLSVASLGVVMMSNRSFEKIVSMFDQGTPLLWIILSILLFVSMLVIRMIERSENAHAKFYLSRKLVLWMSGLGLMNALMGIFVMMSANSLNLVLKLMFSLVLGKITAVVCLLTVIAFVVVLVKQDELVLVKVQE